MSIRVNAESFREFLDRSNVGELRNYLMEAFANNYVSPRSMVLTRFLAGQGIHLKHTGLELEELMCKFDTYYIVRNPRGVQRMIAVPTGYEQSDMIKGVIEPNEHITNIFRNKPDMQCTYVAPRKPYNAETSRIMTSDQKPSVIVNSTKPEPSGVSLSQAPTVTSSMANAMLSQVTELPFTSSYHNPQPSYATHKVAGIDALDTDKETAELAHKHYGEGAAIYGPDFREW